MPTITIKCVSPNGWHEKSGTSKASTSGVYAGYDKGEYRAAMMWLLSTLPPGVTVTQVRLWVSVEGAGGAAGLWDINPYGGNGQDHPCNDDLEVFFNKCRQETPYINDLTEFRVKANYWFNLGAQACRDIENAKAAVDRFSLGFSEEGGNDPFAWLISFYATREAILEITYTEGAPPVGYQYNNGLVSIQVAA